METNFYISMAVTGAHIFISCVFIWIFMRWNKFMNLVDMRLQSLEQISDAHKIYMNNHLAGVLDKLQQIDENTKDLALRLSIAEVRLEERKPSPQVPQITHAPRKRPGPKPKAK